MSGTPSTVGGRYQLGEMLGRGGMAEVRKGTDERLGRVVAVKRLRTDLASDATFQARFRREAQSSASLNHPAIVAVYDTGEEEATDGSGVQQPYIVMEYVAGRTLRDLVLGHDTDLTGLPWVGHRSPRWEPEPLRWLGINAGLRATTLADAEESLTGRPSLVARAVAPLLG